tara:strand:+ start:135 stop:524 length:390 start_codon:yes stop_codon:yes gene_type:complete
MDLSLFLAQVFGIYFVIGGIGLILKPKTLPKFIQRFSSNRVDVMMGGFLALLIGAPLVLLHNIWDGAVYQTVVTVLVWLTFLKGAARILMPDAVVTLAQKMEHKPNLVNAMLWLMVVLGGYLLYVGFGI